MRSWKLFTNWNTNQQGSQEDLETAPQLKHKQGSQEELETAH